MTNRDFLRLAVPAVAAITSLLLFDAYSDQENKVLTGAVRGAAFAVGAGLSFQLLLAGLIPSLRLPVGVLLAGASSSALLVSGLRRFLQEGALRPFQQSLECPPVDPVRMSPEEFRTTAFRMHKRARVVRVMLSTVVWLPAADWVYAMWHSPRLLVTLGCGVSLAGWVYGVYKMQRAFAPGRLDANPPLAMCLEFCRANLEGRLDLLRCAWPRILGPLLAGALTSQGLRP